MKFKLNIIFIFTIILSSCSSQFIVDHKYNEIIPVKSDSDSITNTIILPYRLGIDSIMNEVLCVSDLEMTKGRPESILGNFVSDLCLEQFSNQARYLYYEYRRFKKYSPERRNYKRRYLQIDAI